MTGEKIEMTAASADDSQRERSTIQFPYGDLDDALEVVLAIHSQAGTECETDQLAAFLNQSVKSGAFRLKLQAARMAGLIEVERGTVKLTALGRQAADENKRRRVMSEAFLNIELYEKIFEKYKGHQLPPTAALEREMANLGVARKQTSKARQAFERCAEQSGFYNDTKDRLVRPMFRDSPPPPPEGKTGESGGGGSGGAAVSTGRTP